KSEIQRRFDEIVAFAEIDKFIDTPVKHYSSGMYVRLAFAVAAHLEPEVLMVDEVLAVGDLQFQKKCLGKMQSVSQTGRTVLFVSHNMSAITRLCSTAISLDGGRLLESGPACDVVSHYLASTMGTPGAAIWTDPGSSPGTNEFRLAAVRLVDGAGMAVNVTNIEQPLDLQIDYLVLKPGLRFRCTASFNTGGTCAFSTLEPTEILRQGSGRYRSTVRIPGNLLAEGEYTVGISIFASRAKKMHYCKVDDVVVFQVYDPVSGSSARGDYAEGLSGVTRPLLSWHTEYLR
nr:ABC transporter ATP-binding protein [Anaerolineae bacterium]